MRKILFQHIPKTAGTALITSAEWYFGRATCPARYECEITAELIRDPVYRFYHGHFSRTVVTTFRRLWPDAFIFTFVRHPFTRTLSHYYNWTDPVRVRRELDKVAGRHIDHERVTVLRDKFERFILGLSLDEFLQSSDPDVHESIYNLQAQFLTDVAFPDHLRFNKVAVNAMCDYDFIGMQELYAPCLRIIELSCDLPCGVLGGDERINSNDIAKPAGKYAITAAQFARLEHNSIYDLVLFHLSHALLLKFHGALLPSGAHDIDRLADLPIVDDVVAATAYRAVATTDAC